MNKSELSQLQLLGEELRKAGLIGDDLAFKLGVNNLTREEIAAELAAHRDFVVPAIITPKHRYVLGFMFNEAKTHVLLVKKNRPAWQAGLLNGIGSKIEPGEQPLEAMEREFQEETGYIRRSYGEHYVDDNPWLFVGRRCRPALFEGQDNSYEMFIFATTFPDTSAIANKHAAMVGGYIAEFQDSPIDEPIINAELDLNQLNDIGVPELVWHVKAALDSINNGFRFEAEDPLDLTHLE